MWFIYILWRDTSLLITLRVFLGEVPDAGFSGRKRLNCCLIWPTMSSQHCLVRDVFHTCRCHDHEQHVCFTTLLSSGYQTLGEEYVNIIQVDPSQRRIPSRGRRTALVLFHAFVPYVLDKILICVENELETEAREMSRTWSPASHLRFWIHRAVGMLTEAQRKSLLPLVFALQQGITLFYRLHVAIFYITGSFYHISKRAAGVQYVSYCYITHD